MEIDIMAKDFAAMEDSNRSSNPSIHEVSDPARRTLLGFKSVPVSTADTVTVPEGYSVQVIAPWGESVGLSGDNPVFRPDASNTAAEQEAQLGMHHDGIHYFAQNGSAAGLLVMNHEYSDDGLLHSDGMATWTAQKVRKSQAAHGVSVIEIEQKNDRWQIVRPSPWARRISTLTPIALSGPASGHALLKTAADPRGQRVIGTLNNCASGITPWGTYLTCEENFINYFKGPDEPDAHQRRWGLRKGDPAGYRWHEHDERFDASKHPNEANRFGWVVEIDPFNPSSVPVKRTALGRAAHEGATVALTKEGRAVVYMGEDSRFEYEYITKFVSRDRMQPGGAAANAGLLDHGTLFVARFDADGKGAWIALTHGQGPLIAANGFADQGELLIKTRQASDLLGATKMDRPEWIAVATRQQRHAGSRYAQRRDPALSRRPGGLRADRRQRHARRPHDVRQHPAPGRNSERTQRPGQPAPLLQLARQPPGRPAAFGDAGDPQERRWGDRQLSRRAPRPRQRFVLQRPSVCRRKLLTRPATRQGGEGGTMKIRCLSVAGAWVLAAAWLPAMAQTSPPMPASAGSAPPRPMVVKPAPRPLTPIEMQNKAAMPGDLRPENPVTPQISIPFGKQPPAAHPAPAAQRASTAAASGAGVGDAAAKCEARKGEQVRVKCREQLAHDAQQSK
ncbi:MAG TPA: alkaline phosphatase PhoX [Rhizobacter sp.]|nr:alkaline phosphatase PhoX [Rhizobacter sp.]